jgi:hypothetical protein
VTSLGFSELRLLNPYIRCFFHFQSSYQENCLYQKISLTSSIYFFTISNPNFWSEISIVRPLVTTFILEYCTELWERLDLLQRYEGHRMFWDSFRLFIEAQLGDNIFHVAWSFRIDSDNFFRYRYLNTVATFITKWILWEDILLWSLLILRRFLHSSQRFLAERIFRISWVHSPW